jgi:uncharacterized protein (TIGR03435 family)
VLVLPQERLLITGSTMADLIRRAHGGEFFSTAQVDGPDWLHTERFDIKASSNVGVRSVNGVLNRSDVSALLLFLLRAGYNFSAGIQHRRVAGYRLLKTNHSAVTPGLRAAASNCVGPFEFIAIGATTRAVPCPFAAAPGRLKAGALSMPQFASLLAEFPAIKRVVRDNTKLAGKYDVDLTFDPTVVIDPDGIPRRRSIGSSAVGLRLALKEQLGLTIEPGSFNANVIVVNRIDRPPT